MRLRTVSMGYEMMPATVVTVCQRRETRHEKVSDIQTDAIYHYSYMVDQCTGMDVGIYYIFACRIPTVVYKCIELNAMQWFVKSCNKYNVHVVTSAFKYLHVAKYVKVLKRPGASHIFLSWQVISDNRHSDV